MANRPDTERYLDLPTLHPWRSTDRIEQIHSILNEHDFGSFSRSAPLVDEILTDERIAGVFEQRIAGLKAAPLTFEPAGPRRAEKKIADRIGGVEGSRGMWREIVSPETLGDLVSWGITLGVGVGEIIWNRTAKAWTPWVRVWHPEWLRWDQVARRFILSTTNGQVVLPRPDEQPRGDGKWIVFCPYGVEGGWKRALVRSLALLYLSRQWLGRDWDRYDESRALGILKGMMPANAQHEHKDEFFRQLNNIGAEAAVACPVGKDGESYDVAPVEFTGRNWESFKERKAALDTDIAIRVLGQNLTTEVQGGSLAASQTHQLVRLDKAKVDAEIGPALRAQVLTWWAEFNFGDPELAPWPTFQVAPPEDEMGEANSLKALGDAVSSLQLAEPRVDSVAILEEHGVPLISEEEFAAMEEEEPEPVPPPFGGGGPPFGGGEDPAQAKLSATPGVVKRYTFAGLPIAVENPAGSIRLWAGEDGKQGSTRMACDYGFIEGHLSGDDEEIDVYIGPNESAEDVHIVHQLAAPGYRRWDEDKVMLGFASANDAKDAYLTHRNDGERAFGGMLTMSLERFKKQLRRRGPEATGKIRARAVPSARGAVALRSPRAKRRADRYEDRLAARSAELAAKAMGPDVAALQEEIRAATSFDDLRKRVLRKFKGMDPAKLADVMRKSRILAHFSGRASALEEV